MIKSTTTCVIALLLLFTLTSAFAKIPKKDVARERCLFADAFDRQWENPLCSGSPCADNSEEQTSKRTVEHDFLVCKPTENQMFCLRNPQSDQICAATWIHDGLGCNGEPISVSYIYVPDCAETWAGRRHN